MINLKEIHLDLVNMSSSLLHESLENLSSSIGIFLWVAAICRVDFWRKYFKLHEIQFINISFQNFTVAVTQGYWFCLEQNFLIHFISQLAILGPWMLWRSGLVIFQELFVLRFWIFLTSLVYPSHATSFDNHQFPSAIGIRKAYTAH